MRMKISERGYSVHGWSYTDETQKCRSPHCRVRHQTSRGAESTESTDSGVQASGQWWAGSQVAPSAGGSQGGAPGPG